MLKLFIFMFCCAILAAIWGFLIEPNLLTVSRYKIKDDQIHGLRVVFATDFHLAPRHQKRLNKIVATINRQHPDLIILGGDYVNGHTAKTAMPIEEIAAGLKKLTAPLGVYAVLGNHDWMLNGERISAELKKQNIVVLLNDHVVVEHSGQQIFLAGLEDYNTRKPDINEALKNTRQPRILVSHSPDSLANLATNVNLALAGHTHGGQVKIPFLGPFIIPSDFGHRYAEGKIVENGNLIIVSRGLGTSMLPIRFNCVPEIVVIDFE